LEAVRDWPHKAPKSLIMKISRVLFLALSVSVLLAISIALFVAHPSDESPHLFLRESMIQNDQSLEGGSKVQGNLFFVPIFFLNLIYKFKKFLCVMKIRSLPCICEENGLRSSIENNDRRSICSETHIKLSKPIDITGKQFLIECDVSDCNSLICLFNYDKYGCTISGRGSHRLFFGSPDDARFLDIEFRDGKADTGGVALLTGGSTTFSGCKFYGNKATGNGGAISATGHVTSVYIYSANFFRDNSASYGGAIYVADGADLKMEEPDNRFEHNRATADGGAIAVKNGTATIEGCTFGDNMATGKGGAISATGSSIVVDIYRDDYEEVEFECNFLNNSASYGGAIYVADGADLQMIGSEYFDGNGYHVLQHNSATADGGAIAFKNGTATIKYCDLVDNMATGNGTEISATGSSTRVTIKSTYFGHVVDPNGRDIYVADGAIVVVNE
jgi:predicted outer membrane repeat protein